MNSGCDLDGDTGMSRGKAIDRRPRWSRLPDIDSWDPVRKYCGCVEDFRESLLRALEYRPSAPVRVLSAPFFYVLHLPLNPPQVSICGCQSPTSPGHRKHRHFRRAVRALAMIQTLPSLERCPCLASPHGFGWGPTTIKEYISYRALSMERTYGFQDIEFQMLPKRREPTLKRQLHVHICESFSLHLLTTTQA